MLKKSLVRARVTIRGTRTLLQHAFTENAIPLEKGEKTGVAGNDPDEWKKTCLVTANKQLYIKPESVFGCLRDGARYTRAGRGSLQPLVAATLQVEEELILLNRYLPKKGDPPRDKTAEVFVDVCGVKNPSTKARNVRYRLAANVGWECRFTILWDRTIVSRDQMRAIITDAGVLVGIGDGRSVGKGRFEVVKFKELTDAEEAPAEGGVGQPAPDRVGKRREEMPSVRGASKANGMSHRSHRERQAGDEQD